MFQSTGNAAASRKDWNARDSEGVSNDIVWVESMEAGMFVVCPDVEVGGWVVQYVDGGCTESTTCGFLRPVAGLPRVRISVLGSFMWLQFPNRELLRSTAARCTIKALSSRVPCAPNALRHKGFSLYHSGAFFIQQVIRPGRFGSCETPKHPCMMMHGRIQVRVEIPAKKNGFSRATSHAWFERFAEQGTLYLDERCT